MAHDQTTQDGQLIGRVCWGDLDALGELYDKYRMQVFRVALSITKNREVAEDILQEVFLKLYNFSDRIDPTVSLAPWLYRVTANLCYTQISRHRRWLLTALEDVIESVVAPSSLACPERQAERSELQTIVQQAIDALGPSQRIVIVLYYLADLSLKEIAFILEVPEGTVKSRLHYGRKTMKRRLEKHLKLLPEVAYEFT